MTDAELRKLTHDLRSPLAVIDGLAGLLGSDQLDDATRADYVRRIADAAAEMRALLDQAAK